MPIRNERVSFTLEPARAWLQSFERGQHQGIVRKQNRSVLEADAQAVKAVRKAIGLEVSLMIDANGAYDAVNAIRLARRIEDCDVAWFEDPVRVRKLFTLMAITGISLSVIGLWIDTAPARS